MDGYCLPRRGRGCSREPVRLRLSLRLTDLHTAQSCYLQESTSEGLAIRLPAAARKMTFRRLSGPLTLVSRQERCSRIRYARVIKTCKHARGQYYMVTGYDSKACDNNMRHVGMCIHSKGAYAYQPQGEGATDHWLLAAMARVAGQTAFKITSIPTRRELLSDARVCRR